MKRKLKKTERVIIRVSLDDKEFMNENHISPSVIFNQRIKELKEEDGKRRE